MGGSILQTVLYALGGCLLGAVIAWSIQAVIAKRRIEQLTSEAGKKLSDVIGQRDAFARKYSKSRSTIEALQATTAKLNTELESVIKKSKLLARNVITLRNERENTKIKIRKFQDALSALRRQTTALQSEFNKSRDFYKRELVKSFDKRKLLEEEIKEARSEQEAFAKRVESATLEHGSAEDMIIAAQLRLGQLEVLERNVNKLEAENTQLNQDILKLKRKFEARERDLAELDELRIHNKQLVHCVEALEGSRKEYETDAERYREQADQSEKQSETLRLRLDDLEKNFANIEQEQDQALKDVREADVVPILRKQR